MHEGVECAVIPKAYYFRAKLNKKTGHVRINLARGEFPAINSLPIKNILRKVVRNALNV